MASSRLMPSSSSASPDLARQPSIYSPTISELQGGDPAAKGFGSMSMDDLFRNIYCRGGAVDVEPDASVRDTVDEALKEIAAGRKAEDGLEMTLEDFLARAGAVPAEDVRVPFGSAPRDFVVDSVVGDRFGQQPQFALENPILGFENGAGTGGGGGRGKGRKRPALDPVDRAALQRQKRMIKNRESAARSRERKQAYTVELESLVTQLEEENARLVREQEELKKQRLKQLMENLIPVTERKKPRRVLRRTLSFSGWESDIL